MTDLHFMGLGDTVEAEPTEFKLDPDIGYSFPVVIISTAEDTSGSPAHTPTTTLRRGLVLGRITASKKFSQYVAGNSDGTETAIGILDEEVSTLNDQSTAEDKLASAHVGGVYDQDKVYGLDAAGRVDLRLLLGTCWKDEIFG